MAEDTGLHGKYYPRYRSAGYSIFETSEPYDRPDTMGARAMVSENECGRY
jgi:hypothetical protein